ncbi:MAG: amidase [Proteobacteria bacterium]|nr:amidase [Pseudomonadota bacterium]
MQTPTTDDCVYVETFDAVKHLFNKKNTVHRQPHSGLQHENIPFSVKDLFDLAGQVTRAGSIALSDAPVAKRDAIAIARLKAKGFVAVGRTNMTEFAYSGVGLNPHYGTPLCSWDRQSARIPGGSSSGAALSVANGSVPLAIGTDTGGSCRVPAAFNGVVGFKSSVGRVPLDGVFPLSKTFDSVGPIANTVACCAIADAIMAGDWDGRIHSRDPKSLKLGVLQSLVLDDLDPEVATTFEKAIKHLSSAGISLIDAAYNDLNQLPSINARGGLVAVEAYAVHRELIEQKGELYDPRVKQRILSGKNICKAEQHEIKAKHREMIASIHCLLQGFDGFIMPTVPIIPPAINALNNDKDYARINYKCLRNTFIANFLECCAISLPIQKHGQAPVGLMIMAPLNADQSLFSVAKAVEELLSKTY